MLYNNLVQTGGYLFEYFMWTSPGYSNYRRWTKFYNEMDERGLDIDIQYKIIKENMNDFVGWLLFHIGRIGSNGISQLFYITLTCSYFGLSRDGIDAMYRYGYGVSLSTFDDLRRDCKELSITESRYIISIISLY